MDDSCNLIGKSGLGVVDVPLRILILCNFFKRHEGEELHELDCIRVCNISPVLVEVIWRIEGWIQEYCTLLALTHLLSVSTHDEIEGKTEALLSSHSLDKVDSCHDVSPLVCSTDLKSGSKLLVKLMEVVGLEKLIVELYER